jgi:histidine triad (HIT) family protein
MSRDPDCIFCKIIDGAIPSMKVYEDDACFSFLDIGPLADGHLLVIPKDHHQQLDTMSAELVGRVTGVLPILARAVIQVTGAAGYNVLQNNGRLAGQAVDHVHFHIIPRQADDGLGYRWNAGQYPPGRAEQLHEAIQKTLAPS